MNRVGRPVTTAGPPLAQRPEDRHDAGRRGGRSLWPWGVAEEGLDPVGDLCGAWPEPEEMAVVSATIQLSVLEIVVQGLRLRERYRTIPATGDEQRWLGDLRLHWADV